MTGTSVRYLREKKMLLVHGSVVGLMMAWVGVVWSLPIQPASLILAGLGVSLLSPFHHLRIVLSDQLNRFRPVLSKSTRPIGD